MPPETDLVIAFRASSKNSLSKQQAREDIQKAEQQYSRLIETLSYAGLRAVGRRGETLGHLLVFVSCPTNIVNNLVKRERQTDFLSGLPTTPVTNGLEAQPLSPSERIRLIHNYITATPADGGLGVTPDSTEWDLIESVLALHDREFNEQWIHAWTTSRVASVQQGKIREQFGDSVALYFSFLDSYTRALVFPAVLGIIFYFFGTPYSPLYSVLILLWSVVFVEWWRLRERILSLRFGTRGSFRVEKRRVQHIPGHTWWLREVRILASLPVILLFAGVLMVLLTAIFVFEAFVTQLYTGPGNKYVSFTPTVLFVVLVPRFLAIYQAFAKRFTEWENHAHHSSYVASLTLKTFALSALVAYMGLGLSAFVYVPFGEPLMRFVQVWLFNGSGDPAASKGSMWDANTADAGKKLNSARLKDQMFAYTVTNQVVNTFLEIGLPFVLRGVSSFRNGKKPLNKSLNKHTAATPRKRVVFEDEKEKGGAEEREFLERVREEVALPEYNVFEDYSEMVMQFGYVVLWSTIWPLAPVMALVNNFFELRSDAFKITVHNRRPIPTRTDTIGPWLDALTFLTWLGALTNSALVYLFCPRTHCGSADPTATRLSSLDKVQHHLMTPGMAPGVADNGATRELLVKALLIALLASHGFIALRGLVRHVLERAVWKASEEVRERERDEREVKEHFLKGLESEAGVEAPKDDEAGLRDAVSKKDLTAEMPFWDHDEGLEEIRRISKEA